MSYASARLTLLAALTAVALVPYRADGQPGGVPGGPPPGAGTLFGGDKKVRETFGPSLAATDEPVVEIRVEGNKTIPEARITSQMSTRVGRPFDPQALARDVRKLAELPWFVTVRPLSESTSQGRIIVLRVVERPTIRYVEYLGNVKLKDRRLIKETGLKVGAAVDPYLVEDGRRKILDAYRDNGYRNAQVAILEGDKPTDQGVVYVINEGVQQKVWAVRFEGNDSDFASDRRLKTKIKSKPGFLYLIGGKLNREVLDADVEALTSYYRSFGFFQARVGRTLDFDDSGKWATLRFVIHEGPRYEVRNVRFLGNQKYSAEALATGIQMPAGKPFEQDKMNADVEWLKEVYGSQGHVFANIRAEPVYLEEPGQIDLIYHIEEGKRWRVGRIFVHIEGDAQHTRIATALNRLSIRTGDIMDSRELRASERRLQAASLFHVDPARGVAPKITYQIPELGDEEFTASAGGADVRGQSPEPTGWGLTERFRDAGRRVYEAIWPAEPQPADGAMDLHLHLDAGDPAEPAAPPVPAPPGPVLHSAYKPPVSDYVPGEPSATSIQNAAYLGLDLGAERVVLGQSPAPAPYPAAGYPAAPAAAAPYPQAGAYGGAAVRATDPQAAPVNYHQQPVTPVQYQQPMAPVGAPPAPMPPPAGVVVDPSVTPIPPSAQLFPNGEFGPPGAGYTDPAVDVHVNLQETQTGRFMVGVGVNSDAGVVGQITIDERNFDWTRVPTSWRDWYDGTAFRGAGQRFRIEAQPGTEVQRYLVSFQEPYFLDSPVSLSLSGSYFDRRFEDWDEQRLGGRVGLGYQWTENDLSASLSYRGENVQISNPAFSSPEIDEVLGDNALHGFGVTVANDTRNNPFLATEGHYVSVSLEQVVGSFIYPRAILDARKYFLLNERPDHSGRHVLVAQTQLGFTGSDTPLYDRFYAGGFSTMRGFDFRGASPRVGGDFMFLNTVEYMFPLTADDMVNGVVFCDFGTVEDKVEINDFRVAPGVGLRITVPAMGPAPIALDFAWPIQRADTDDLQVFTFNVGFLR